MTKKTAQTTSKMAPKKRTAPTRKTASVTQIISRGAKLSALGVLSNEQQLVDGEAFEKQLAEAERSVVCIVSNTGAVSYGLRGDRKIDRKVRTYAPTRIDDRSTGLLRKTTLKALAKHLVGKNGHQPVIARVCDLIELGWYRKSEFAPVID